MVDMILDTETTGLNKTDVIVEIAIIRMDNGEPLMNTLVKPAVPISSGAMEIHGITEEMVKNAPSWKELHQQFLDITSQCDTMHIYNSPFDIDKIIETAAQAGFQLTPTDFGKNQNCVMREYARIESKLWPEYGDTWSKLIHAAHTAGFQSVDPAHRALNDCRMTRAVCHWIEEKKVILMQREKKRLADQVYREKSRKRKMRLVPDGTHINREKGQYRVFDKQGNEYEYFKFGAPKHEALKTLSKLKLSELDRAEFVGMCTSTYGDEGYVFKIKEVENE